MSKKKTKAGIRKCSAVLLQCSRAISETRTRLAAFGARHQLAQIVGAVGDVGIGEPEKFRLQGCGMIAALAHRPELAGPARRPRAAGQHRQPVAAQPARQIGGAVVAEVIHQHDMEVAGIILRQQAADALLDHIGFVARRHHRHHGRPCRRLRRPAAVSRSRSSQKPRRSSSMIKPDRQRHKAEQDARDHCRYPFSRNQASASFRPSL